MAVDIKGFLKVKRKYPEYRPVCERVKDYQPVFVLRDNPQSQEQATRCMDCGTPFATPAVLSVIIFRSGMS